MSDNFRVRANKVFGSISSSTSSFPKVQQSSPWSITDDAIERREWKRGKDAGTFSNRNQTAANQSPRNIKKPKGKISGLSPGLHGFHIHALGDTSNGCNSTGPHFNPLKNEHGAPSDKERHASDLGNIVTGPDKVAEVSL
ncbi:hypothetical protein ACFX2I_015203 [Malus domestica]